MKQYINLQPTITGSFSFGWKKMFEKAFLTLLLAVVIVGLLNGPMGVSWKSDNFDWINLFWIFPVALVGIAYTFLFKPVIDYGERYLFLKAIRDEEADLMILFEGFKNKYFKIVLANLIVIGLIIIGFVLLIVPGIIVMVRLVFVPFLVMDKNMEPMEAVEKSWQMTRGHGWKIFGMGLLSLLIIIAGLLVFFFGVIISFMWIHSAFATLYQTLLNQNQLDNPIPILGVNEA
ncbi:MAG TPA: hypothetical protein VFD91_15000 [Mariniphaga sp.]|nr:hypothetical protein [Mariniphaga sp.]